MQTTVFRDERGAAGAPTEMGEPTDSELMLAVRHGDVARLGTLFERHHRHLYNFLRRMTGDPQTSEDLVQEVFFRALKYRHTYQDRGEFTAWLFRLARNAAADHRRRSPDGAAAPEPAGEPESPSPLPQEELEQSEALRLLQAALLRLPEDRREVLLLARFQHLRHREIGRLLGCTAGAVKVRVHRALKQLREVYLEMVEPPAEAEL